MEEKIRVNGEVIGSVIKDEYLGINEFRIRKKPKHLFRKYNSFGLSEEAIRQLLDLNINKIKFMYHNKGNDDFDIYVTTVDKFVDTNLETINEGDKQKHVPLNEMIAYKKRQPIKDDWWKSAYEMEETR